MPAPGVPPTEPQELPIDPRAAEKYGQFLARSETIVYTTRRHPIVIARAVAISLGWFLLIGFLAAAGVGRRGGGGILGLFLLGVTAYLGAAVAEWRFDHIVITNKRVIKIEGIVNRRVSTIPLGKITDTSYRRTWVGRILKYGDMVLDTPGQDKYLPILDKLANPDRLYSAIVGIAIGGGPPAAAPPPRAPTEPAGPGGPAGPAAPSAIPRRKPPGGDDTAVIAKPE